MFVKYMGVFLHSNMVKNLFYLVYSFVYKGVVDTLETCLDGEWING